VAEDVTHGHANCKTSASKDAPVISEGAIPIILRKRLLKSRLRPERGTGEVTRLAVRKLTCKQRYVAKVIFSAVQNLDEG